MKEIDKLKELFDGEEIEEIEGQSIVLQIGEAVKGIYRAIEDSEDNQGRPIKLLIMDTPEGLMNMAIPKTLSDILSHINPGDVIGIQRAEDGTTKDGLRTFKNFRVVRSKKLSTSKGKK